MLVVQRSLALNSPAWREAKGMDFDFRASSLHSARHLSAVQAARLHLDNHSFFDDSDGQDDARSYFPCPFCYMDIEICTFCGHLQEEHCYDLNNAVCPLCAANLGKDAIGHFAIQHSSSLKWRRRSEKSSVWTGSSAIHSKKLPTNARGNKLESTTDPLLSPFTSIVPLQNLNSIQLDETSSDSASDISDAKSMETYVDVLDGRDKQDRQERRQKAAFVQELIASTIF
ncbi:Protein DEHYDRATION-INDUCED 19 like [Quillaja saponaria]|uniref:Protein DEHYDRATION-INDUCED 19 like n=1 Tax=Quillaja saponaria TaxID=32244 RepID=A0AAD7KVG0_QUISA|nr:Protein DEHYDRATION-INDUCED 19 like [Quillaja saponaria]